MKKTLYLCGLIMLSMSMMAQTPIDRNYSLVFSDDFDSTGRFWQDFVDYPDQYWRAYCGEFPAGVTRGTNEHQVYRPQNCVFNPANSVIELIAEYAGHRLSCGEYEIPQGYECDDNHGSLFYYSGNIETMGKFRYGYFEIRCKLPFHPGSFPAFWLWGASDSQNYYEEIDIMEYGYGDPIGNGLSTVYSTGCMNNTNGTSPLSCYGHHVELPSYNDITQWHVYGCEWLPDRIVWYLDDEAVGQYCIANNIPRHGMTLKANYSIGNSALFNANQPEQYAIWEESDTMIIDYINVYQLSWDCSTDEDIACQSDLDTFEHKVKKSISITSSMEDVVVSSTDTINFRVSDFFEITGPFAVQNEGILSISVHACME